MTIRKNAEYLRILGDVEGHAFHGNQWTTNGQPLNEKQQNTLKKYGDIGPYKVKPVIGDDPKPQGLAESLKREANVLYWDLQQMTPGRATTLEMQKHFDGLNEHISKLEPLAQRHLKIKKP